MRYRDPYRTSGGVGLVVEGVDLWVARWPVHGNRFDQGLVRLEVDRAAPVRGGADLKLGEQMVADPKTPRGGATYIRVSSVGSSSLNFSVPHPTGSARSAATRKTPAGGRISSRSAGGFVLDRSRRRSAGRGQRSASRLADRRHRPRPGQRRRLGWHPARTCQPQHSSASPSSRGRPRARRPVDRHHPVRAAGPTGGPRGQCGLAAQLRRAAPRCLHGWRPRGPPSTSPRKW